MNPVDTRRKRQISLFLAAILIPSAVLITFAFRLARQDGELADKHMADQRRDALDQLRRELALRLETIKLQEINRLSGDPASLEAPSVDFPVLFVAPLVQNRLILPWERASQSVMSPPAFTVRMQDGETREFVENDFQGASEAYSQARALSPNPADRCASQLSESRSLTKAAKTSEAAQIYQSMLDECGSVEDADQMSFGLYAAERLMSLNLGARSAEEYIVRRSRSLRWLPPVQAYLMRSLLQSSTSTDAKQALGQLAFEIHDVEQILALASDLNRLSRIDFPFHVGPGNSVWLAYGDEPWLITMMSTASFAPPVVLAVSSRKIAPTGVSFRSTKSATSLPLGEGFVAFEVEFPAGRFAPATSIPPVLYAGAVLLILSVTLLAAYLLLRDVSREIEVAEMRSHFVASVSHELKTPLTAIRMYAETLAMGRATDEQTRAEYLQTVVNESERLSRLVDNVLDFSRIERGKKIYRMQPISLQEVVRAAAKAMQYPLNQHGFTLNLSIDEVPTVLADADALEQAVLNLLANAMKYSGDAREIDLSLGQSEKEAVIKVIDRGIGIAAEDHPRIFEKFYRVRSSPSERIPGTGLGLTLATHVVKAHGGQLHVSSELGRGSTFSICLPLKELQGQGQTEAPS